MKFTIPGGRMEASTQVPETILKLVEKYEYHQAAYKRGQFNEAQLRYGLTEGEIRIVVGAGK